MLDPLFTSAAKAPLYGRAKKAHEFMTNHPDIYKKRVMTRRGSRGIWTHRAVGYRIAGGYNTK